MKEKLIALLNTINKIEVKGQDNIFLMYTIIAFLQKEISELEQADKENQGG